MARVGSLIAVLGAVLSLLGSSSSALAQSCQGWANVYLTGRHGHAMTYDSARGVTVLFGGWDNFSDGETWEWDGTAWTFKARSGPSSRTDHEMVYDSVRGVTVLFGGLHFETKGTLLGDTWEWDGNTWTLRANSGPSAGGGYAMAYDSARGVTVLFGGTQTWEWYGGAWTRRSVSGPSKRYEHAMAYDSARRVTVLFGGDRGGGVFTGDETWEWDGGGAASWTSYGAGWPGTNGIPSFTASDPVLCTTIGLDLANSSGASTLAALFVGLVATDQPTNYDGHVLVFPTNILLLSLPSGGLAFPGPLPCDSVFCGLSIFLQALEVDPGASEGIAFTPGLRLVLGS
jgi:hypothetical protein